MTHAFLGPSGLAAALLCKLKIHSEKGLPNSSNQNSAQGTAAHELAQCCLEQEHDARYFLGLEINHDNYSFTVDDDMAKHVQTYVDYVRSLENDDGVLMVEQKLPITELTGEPDAFGTADAVVIVNDVMHVVDLKYGMGIRVDAENNPQLRAYGFAALQEFDIAGEIQYLELHIVQPRAGGISTEIISADDLRAWAVGIRRECDVILAGPVGLVAQPGEKQCKFCRAKGSCTALADMVTATVIDDFVDLTERDEVERKLGYAIDRIQRVDNATLAGVMPHLDMILGWCDGVRAEAASRMLAGQEIAGYKVVDGKRGARSWGDDAEAIAAFKKMRLPLQDMYDMKLISPVKAEKLLKDTPRKWAKVSKLITQSQGRPAVVPVTDKRPAVQIGVIADEFPLLTTESEL